MRPKKRILLVSADETWRDRTGFLLNVHGFAVHDADTESLAAASESSGFDAVVAHVPGTAQAREDYRCGSTPVVVVTDKDSSAQLLEGVRCAVAKLRGPVPAKGRVCAVRFARDAKAAA